MTVLDAIMPFLSKQTIMMSDWEWKRKYQRLVDFRNRFGHTNVHIYEGDEYQDLCDWLSHQRTLYKYYKDTSVISELSLEKVTLLEAIDSELESDKQSKQIEEPLKQRNDTLGNEGTFMQNIPRNEVELMDIADAYVIRAVLHSPERRRAHNELMHSSHRALFTGSFNENDHQQSKEVDDGTTTSASDSNNCIDETSMN